jgi:hypothetical protein
MQVVSLCIGFRYLFLLLLQQCLLLPPVHLLTGDKDPPLGDV